MTKLSDKKLSSGQISKLSAEDQAKIFEPIFKANNEQFKQIASDLADARSLAKSINSITSSLKQPVLEYIKDFKLPKIPSYKPIEFNTSNFERYDQTVIVKKNQRELKQETLETYRTELQIKVLERQLNIYEGILAPQYELNTGIITFLGKQIIIPLNTNLEMVCRVVLKNSTNMKRKWSWEEIVEKNRELPENYTARKIYNASRSINDKVAMETQVKKFFLTKPFSTVQLNPQLLAK